MANPSTVVNSAVPDGALIRAGEPQAKPIAPVVPRNPGLADWFPSAENVYGTNENKVLIENLSSNAEFSKEKQRIELAFSLDKRYEAEAAAYTAELQRVTAANRTGFGVLPSKEPPTRHPYSAWIRAFGESSDEAVTNISATQARVEHIFQRVKNNGFFERLRSDSNLKNEFEDVRLNPQQTPIIADWMFQNGFLKTEEERDLFNRHIGSPYSKYWGVSLYDKIEESWNADNPGGGWRAWDFPTEILKGRKPNPNDPRDVADWERFREWRTTQGGHNWFYNFGLGMGHLIGSFGATLKNAARATVYPEFDWSDNWKVASGENAIRKQKFIDLFNEWLDDPHRDGDAELEAYANAERQGVAPNQLKFPDPAEVKPVSEKTQELLKLYRELNKEGAFNADVHGLSAGLAALDGAVQGTLAIGALFFSTDPDSLFFKLGVAGEMSGTKYHFAREKLLIERTAARARLSDADYEKFVKNQKTEKDIRNAAEMDYFVRSVHGQNWFMNTAKEGLIFSGDYYDSSVGYNTSMWADLFIVAGVVAKGAKVLQGARAQSAIVSQFGKASSAVSREMTALRANVEYLTKKGVEFTGDVKKAIDSAKAELARKLGREVKDVEALDAIMADEKVFKDPVTGQMRSLSNNEKAVIRNKILEHGNEVFAVRRKIADTVKQGRAWTEILSDTSKSTIKKVRERLAEIEPAGGWDKASDHAIYARMRGGPIEKPGVTSAIAISPEEIKKLYSEVGSIWRGVNVTGKSGFRAADSLGVRFWDPAFYGSLGGQAFFYGLEKMSGGLGWLTNKGISWLSNHAVSPGDAQTALRMANTPSHELASTRINVGSQTAVERVSKLNQFIAFGKMVGDFESAAAAAKDYFSAMRNAPVDATNVTHGLKVQYQKRMDEISAIMQNNEARGIKMTAAETKALQKELDMLSMKMKHISRMDASARYGAFNGMNELFGYGGSLMVGEAMMYANDTDSVGLGSGFVTAMRGSHIMSSVVMRNVSPTLTIRERANLDLYSLSERMQHLPPSQAAILLESIARLAERRDATYNEPGTGVFKLSPRQRADIEFAQGLSILDRLYTIHGDVVLTKGTGMIDGVALINSAGEYRSDPKLREALVARLESEAGRLGLSSSEARDYAAQLMRAHEDGVVAEQRKVLIDEEIAQLEGEKKKLADQVSGPLERVKTALSIILKEAGLEPDNLRVDSDSKFYDPTNTTQNNLGNPLVVKYVVNGKEVPVNQIPGVTNKVLARVDAAIQQYRDVQREVLEGNGLIAGLNDRIRALNEEKTGLETVERTPGFYDRPVVMLEGGGYILNRKGLTIWESVSKAEDGTEVTRAKVFLDIESFLERARYVEEIDPVTGKKTKKMVESGGYALALEEYSHALFFAESMRDTRIQMERDILGGWSYDENGILVNKIPDERGVFHDAPAKITGDYKTNLDLIRKYAEAYAEGLPEFAKNEFLARFDYGVHRFEQDKTDTRHLQGVFMELYASMYVQRMMQQNPNVYKSKFGSGQSYQGNWNTAPITAGAGIGERWKKFVFGQQTLVDIMMEGRYDLTKLDPNSPEATNAEAMLNSVMNVVQYFGPGGIRESATKSFIKSRLVQFGLMRRNNNSQDPLSAWSQTEMFSDGRWRDIPLEAQSWVDGGTRHTRNVGSRIIYDDPWNIQRVIDNENKHDDPNEVRFRVTWAYATGRKHWLSERNDPVRVGAPGQQRQFNIFKDKIENLFWAENQVVRDFVGMVVKDDPNGETFGLKVSKTKAGNNYGLVGMPNPEQAQRVFAWIKEQNRIRTEEDNIFMMNTQTMNIVKEMLSSLSNSTHHKDATSPGYNRVYRGEYLPIRTGLGAGTTATTKAEAPREMTFSPVMLIIKDTTLTAEGKKIFQRTDDDGVKSFLARPMLYVLAMDHNARESSVVAAWQGRLSDKNGTRYKWDTAEMERLFGNFSTFADKVDEVWKNLASGKYGITADDVPENRTWELLMDFAGQDQQKAYKMAAIIHRTIGPFENKFVEISKLEREALRTKSEARRAKLKELIKEKKSELDFEPDQRQQWLASLMQADAREIGAPRMADTRHPFMLIRPDRFVGTPMQMLMNKKQGAVFPITGAAYGFAQIGYADQNPWARVPVDELKSIRSQYQWGSSMLMDVWNHPSGYRVWKVSNRKAGKFQKATFNLIAPDGTVVERAVGAKTAKDFDTADEAFTHATTHSKRNPQDNIPIIGNAVEEAMKAGGWNPRGTKFAINARSEFASADNRFYVRRKSTGGWDLYHNESGIMMMQDVRIYGSETDAHGRRVIDPKELNASVQLAEELGLVEAAMDVDFIRKYVPSTHPTDKPMDAQDIANNVKMFMEWRKDDPLIGITGKDSPLRRRRAFSKNPMYWEWKRALAKATSPNFAIEAAKRMVDELGMDVVEGDVSGVKTQEWIKKFSQRIEEEGVFAAWLDKRSFEQIKADEHAEAARDRSLAFQKDVKAGTKEPSKPTKPDKPIRDAYDTAQAFDEAMLNWKERVAEYEANLRDYEDWHRGMSEREMAQNDEKLRAKAIAFYRELVQKDINTVQTWRFAELGGIDMDKIANSQAIANYQRNVNAIREAGNAVLRDAWLNEAGYLIQSMMYDEPKIGPGIKFQIGGPVPRSRKGGKPAVSFYVFTQEGQLVGNYEDWEIARRAALLHHLGVGPVLDLGKPKEEVKSVQKTNAEEVVDIVKKDIPRQDEEDKNFGRLLRGTNPPRSPSRVPPRR